MVSLDEQGEWYRYHHLFSELLLYELKSSRPDLVPTLRKRASVWLEDAGYFEGAIRQAIAATDYERVGLLIARHWYGYVFAGQTATVQRWLESLPEEMIAQIAPLALVKAWICALGGRREESEGFLTLAESIPHEGPLPDGTASVGVGRGHPPGHLRLRWRPGHGRGGPARRGAGARANLPVGCVGALRAGDKFVSFRRDIAGPEAARGSASTDGGWPAPGADGHAYPSCRSLPRTRGTWRRPSRSRARRARWWTGSGCRGFPRLPWRPSRSAVRSQDAGSWRRPRRSWRAAFCATRLPGLSPWPTLIGLLALAPVRAARGDRAGGRTVLAEARGILETYPDAGMFPELLERQERKLRTRKPREGQLDGELTERELDVLRLLVGELSTRQMAQSLYVAPSTVRTQVKSIYRKLGVSSREDAVEEAHARGLI